MAAVAKTSASITTFLLRPSLSTFYGTQCRHLRFYVEYFDLIFIILRSFSVYLEITIDFSN